MWNYALTVVFQRRLRTNDAPWCVVLHHGYIMDFNRWLSHCETKYAQTLIGGSREGDKTLFYHIYISMAALMAAFSSKNEILTFRSKKPPLEPPLIGNYKRCNFYDYIYSELKGFLNISIIHLYRSTSSSKLLKYPICS